MAAVLAVGSASAGISDIFGSDHDRGTPGNPTCKTCHIPHDAQGDYLWARTPKAGQPASAGLCFSCHDGSITNRGDYIAAPGTVNHRNRDQGHGAMANYGDGYCLGCHDAHDPDWRFTKDLMRVSVPPKPQNPDNANFCLSCHSINHPTRGLGPMHAFDVEDPADNSWRIAENPDVPVSVVQMTPPPGADQTFDPGAGDPEGTRLWDSARQEPVGAGSGKVACLTCHTPHGAVTPYGAVTEDEKTAKLNTMDDNDGAKHAPICENCHQ
ncbi:MAG: cytochrome c3 family protein [Chloroflexota bacterium]|nr:cytochrome c3 family protein [Chloroflexota bacterium]